MASHRFIRGGELARLGHGRAVVFFSDGLVLERGTDGSWSPYDVEEGIRAGDRNQTVFGSVLLG